MTIEYLYNLYKPWANNTNILCGDKNGFEFLYLYYRKYKDFESLPKMARGGTTFREWKLFTSMKLWNGNEWENAV